MGFVLTILYYLLVFFQLILLARVLMTWLPNLDRSNPLIRFVFNVTEPVLQPIRNVLPQNMGLDFSPLIVFLVISLLMRFLF